MPWWWLMVMVIMMVNGNNDGRMRVGSESESQLARRTECRRAGAGIPGWRRRGRTSAQMRPSAAGLHTTSAIKRTLWRSPAGAAQRSRPSSRLTTTGVAGRHERERVDAQSRQRQQQQEQQEQQKQQKQHERARAGAVEQLATLRAKSCRVGQQQEQERTQSLQLQRRKQKRPTIPQDRRPAGIQRSPRLSRGNG